MLCLVPSPGAQSVPKAWISGTEVPIRHLMRWLRRCQRVVVAALAVALGFVLLSGSAGAVDSWQERGSGLFGEVASEELGRAVAISDDGSRMIVGSPIFENDGSSYGKGRARAFDWDGTQWTQVGADVRGEEFGDWAGGAVAISPDGSRIAVGAYGADAEETSAGWVQVFEWDGTTWQQMGDALTGVTPGEAFGISVSLVDDGTRLVAGSMVATRVFDWDGMAWLQVGGDMAGVGRSIAASGDGTRVVAGNSFDATGGTQAGLARMFEWDGSAWAQMGDDLIGSVYDRLGASVVMAETGAVIAVGATQPGNMGSPPGMGVVWVYAWDGDAWTQVGDALPGLASAGWFGQSAAMSGDGMRLVAGGGGPGSGSGVVRVFDWDGVAWVPVGGDLEGDVAGDGLGHAVALSADGRFLAVGAPSNDEVAVSAGLVRFYVRPEVPGPPGAVDVAAGDGEVAVSWAAPDDDGAAAITSYEVVGVPAGSCVTEGATACVIDGLTNGVSYTFSVRAGNAVGFGPFSTVSTPAAPQLTRTGYVMADATGGIYGFGDAVVGGDVTLAPGVTVVDIELTPSGNGYWVLDSGGNLHTYGDAVALGPVDVSTFEDMVDFAVAPDQPEGMVSMVPSQSGEGLLVFTNRGRVVVLGDAAVAGDLLSYRLNSPVIDAKVDPDGVGYWMLAADGGLFAFDAAYEGSLPELVAQISPGLTAEQWLASPVVGVTPDPDGLGYWMVAADGGVFGFGSVPFRGSLPGVLGPGALPNAPIVGMVPYGNGYVMVGGDGGVFNFSNRLFEGSLGANPPSSPVVALSPMP